MYNCDLYGLTLDREYNAAIDIMKMFLEKLNQLQTEFTHVETTSSDFMEYIHTGKCESVNQEAHLINH